MVRATSSHRSSGIETSGRQYGTVTSHPSDSVVTPNPSEVRVVSTTSAPGLLPRTASSLSADKKTRSVSVPLAGHSSMIPFAASPPATSRMSRVVRRRATSDNPARRPFSNRSVAWLCSPKDRDVRRLLALSNVADSRKTFTVESSISVFAPPMTPARPIARSGSEMTSMSPVSLRSASSSVVRSSPSRARRTTTL